MGKIITALKMFKRKKSKSTSPWANVSSGDRLKSNRQKRKRWAKTSPVSKQTMDKVLDPGYKHTKTQERAFNKEFNKTKNLFRKMGASGKLRLDPVTGADRGGELGRQVRTHLSNMPRYRTSKHTRVLKQRAAQTKELVDYGKKMAKKGILPKIKA